LSSSESALAIGTSADEWHRGAGEFENGHSGTGPFAAVIESVEAHRSGSVAWAAVRSVIDTGEPGGFPVRMTLVLTCDEDAGDWRIIQSHASAPANLV
jgi:hypothetical protein